MKLRQVWKDGSAALAIETEAGLVDVAAEAERREIAAPGTMLEAIEGGEQALEVLSALAQDAQCFTDGAPAPAVTGGDKILCIGLNYMRHAAEFKSKIPAAPVIFAKFPNALAADGDRVKLCPDYKEYDYEAELVVVIGRKCKDVPAEEALDYVFGYTCGDDLSTRDLQFTRGNQWILSKNFDGFAPIDYFFQCLGSFFNEDRIPCLVSVHQLTVGIARELGVNRQIYRSVIIAGKFHRKLNTLACARTCLHIGFILLRRKNLLKDCSQLDFS